MSARLACARAGRVRERRHRSATITPKPDRVNASKGPVPTPSFFCSDNRNFTHNTNGMDTLGDQGTRGGNACGPLQLRTSPGQISPAGDHARTWAADKGAWGDSKRDQLPPPACVSPGSCDKLCRNRFPGHGRGRARLRPGQTSTNKVVAI